MKEMNETFNERYIKVSILQAIPKLAQSGRHQSGSQEITGSIPTRGTFSTEINILFPVETFTANIGNFA